jgi:hypothetical protein
LSETFGGFGAPWSQAVWRSLCSCRLPIGRFVFRWRIVGSRVGKIIVVGRVGKDVVVGRESVLDGWRKIGVVCTIVHDRVVDERSLRSLFAIICVVVVLVGAVEIQIGAFVVILVVTVAVFVCLLIVFTIRNRSWTDADVGDWFMVGMWAIVEEVGDFGGVDRCVSSWR